MLGEILTGLAVAALTRMGSHIESTVRKSRDKASTEAAKAADHLARFKFSESALRANVNLPQGVTARTVDTYVKSPQAEALAFEMLTAILVEAPRESLDRARSLWVRDVRESNLSADARFADQLFDAMIARFEIATDAIKEAFPIAHERMRSDAQTNRIACILEGIDRRLSSFDENTPTRDEINNFVRDYREQLKVAHCDITPPDFGRKRKVPIDDIYVSSRFSEFAGDGPYQNPYGQKRGARDLDQFSKVIDRTVLLGDPGHGKSTATQVLLYKMSKNPGAAVPFLVVLRDFSAWPGGKSIVQYIENRLSNYYQVTPPAGVIKHLLLSGMAAVFFDGLDELLDASNRRTITETVELFSNRYPLAKILVTSRRVGYEQAPMDERQFNAYQLSGFDEDQVAEYAQKWFNQEDLSAEERSLWTRSFLDESNSVPDLRRAPLLLALMCIIYRGERSIPKNRPGIYEKCATMLFEKWDSSRGIHSDLRVGQMVDPAMKHLAYWMLTSDEAGGGVKESALVREATEYLHDRAFESIYDAESAAKEFVEFCRGRAWVFTDVGSTSEGESLYSFTHRTFMEYFAAYHLFRLSDSPEKLARSIAPKVASAEWDVVAQLAVQISDKNSDKGAIRVFEYLLKERIRRSPSNRANVLAFLGRCLSFVQVSPQVVRLLTQMVVSNLCDLADRSSPNSGRALGELLLNSEAHDLVVKEELGSLLEHLCSSDESDSRLTGLAIISGWYLSMYQAQSADWSADTFESQWDDYFESLKTAHNEVFLHDLFTEEWLTVFCVLQGVCSLEHALRDGPHGLALLFLEPKVRVFGVYYLPLVSVITRGIIDVGYSKRRHRLRAEIPRVAELIRNGELTYPIDLRSQSGSVMLGSGLGPDINVVDSSEITADEWLLLGFMLLVEVEWGNLSADQFRELELSPIRPLVDLIDARRSGMEMLSVPPFDSEDLSLLSRWARGEVSFTSRKDE